MVEWEIDMRAAGHTTFGREGLYRGFEPDGSFYFSHNAKRMRGKADLDLNAGLRCPTSSSRRTVPAAPWVSCRSAPA